MTCRCGFEMCWRCGGPYNKVHCRSLSQSLLLFLSPCLQLLISARQGVGGTSPLSSPHLINTNMHAPPLSSGSTVRGALWCGSPCSGSASRLSSGLLASLELCQRSISWGRCYAFPSTSPELSTCLCGLRRPSFPSSFLQMLFCKFSFFDRSFFRFLVFSFFQFANS
jgi:hypothetical protein